MGKPQNLKSFRNYLQLPGFIITLFNYTFDPDFILLNGVSGAASQQQLLKPWGLQFVETFTSEKSIFLSANSY